MTIGLLLTALGLGLRHGVDWDHIAAIADLSSTASSRRRGFVLSFLYATGHGAVVFAVGLAAIALGTTLPAGIDEWMGRVVGVTLLVLGAWILVDLVRKGRDFRLRSRWILIFGGTFAGLRRVRDATSRRRVALDHSHDHEHDDAAGVELDVAHGDRQAHDHAHGPELEPVLDLAPESVSVAAREGRSGWPSFGHRHTHRHRHRHEAVLADGRPASAGNGTAAGIGVLHGIGVESPTQIAVFVASTSVVGVGPGMALLAAWVCGLLLANSGLALLAAVGLLEAERNFTIYALIATFVAVASIVMGALLATGFDAVLPALGP